MQHKYIHTTAGLTVILQGRPYSISASHPDFPIVLARVEAGAAEYLVLEALQARATAIKGMLERQLSVNLEYREGLIFYRGEVLRTSVAKHMIEMINRCEDVTAISNFTEKVMQNPVQAVVEELYEFLNFGKIPLTPDGDFLVYKAVREDYKDIHSGTFLNAVGSVCEMPFVAVDPDRNRTCSQGLHVCSYAYLPHFAHAQGHVMLCKVNPRDVVAVPADYNNTKMRVARYTVVGEVTTYYQRGEDVLGTGPGVREACYEVWYRDGDGMSDYYDEYFTIDEARAQANALRERNPGFSAIWVEHANNGDEVLYKV